MDEPTPADTVHVAIDDLLTVVAKAADDLRMFHTAVSHAHIAPLPPFPRTTVVLTLRIVEHLRTIEEKCCRLSDSQNRRHSDIGTVLLRIDIVQGPRARSFRFQMTP